MHYDLIVLGSGGIGSAAMHEAAKRGLRVLGLDRFPAAHDRGSSHGQTRIIRQAYFEHPDYVPLLLRCYSQWSELEKEVNRKLFFQVGLLEAGPADGIVAPGVLRANEQHELGVETLTADEAAQRFPGFRLDPNWLVVHERQAGYLLVEDCIRANIRRSIELGAEHRVGVEVQTWRRDQGGYRVETDAGGFSCDRLVITAGAWASDLLDDLGVQLRVLRKHLHWFTAEADHHQSPNCPVFFLETSEGNFYGFPACDENGIKIAEHSGGVEIEDPLNDERLLDEEDATRIELFTNRHLLRGELERTQHSVCFYTSTADDHFIVDQHPSNPGVAFAAGLSGHGFKFAPVLGQALIDLALDGGTELPIDFFSVDRPALQ
jgi:monomeric sarcosine oxidase